MEAQWPKMEARRGPNATPRAALAPLGARQEASQRAQDRLVHVFASDFDAPKAPKGSRNRTQKRTKSDTKMTFVSDHVSGPIFIDLEVRKASLSGHEKDPKHVPKSEGEYVKIIGKTHDKSIF